VLICKTDASEDELDGMVKANPSLADGYCLRVVRTVNQFFEKTIILELGFNDVAVELYKRLIKKDLEEQLGGECQQFFDCQYGDIRMVCFGGKESKKYEVKIDEQNMA
jgi:hypothetical protein